MKSYRIKYKIEVGEWNPITSESDKKPLPGVRILSSGDSDVGYTDSLIICSLIRGDDGNIESSLWAIDPNLSAKECDELVESLQHHLEHHHQVEGKNS